MEPEPEAAEPPAVGREKKKRERRPKRKTHTRRNSVSGESGRSASLEECEVAEHAKSEDEIRTIVRVIEQCFLFVHLEEEALVRTALAMFKVNKQAGDVIIQQGDTEADNFYVVDSGVCKCYQGAFDDCGLVQVCKPGDGFGELALMYGSARAASVVADTDVSLWALDRSSFSILLMRAALDRRKKHKDFLEYVMLFQALPDYEVGLLADAMETVQYEDGQVICHQGDASEDFFVVQEGEVVVSQVNEENPEPEPELADVSGGGETLLTLQRGDYFGELGLLLDGPRWATCTAQGDTAVGKVHSTIFQRILPKVDKLLRRNARQMYTSGKPLPSEL